MACGRIDPRQARGMDFRRSLVNWALATLLTTSLLAAPWKKGDKLEIKWGETWYRAEVLEVDGERYKVRYDGYSAAWDEWATAAKLRDIVVATTAAAPVAGTPAGAAAAGAWKVDDRVEALSYGQWYPGKLIQVEAARVRVTFDGYSSSSDEWVPLANVRKPGGPAKAVTGPAATPATLAFPARPAGAKAGLGGVWLRVETYFFGTSLSINNEGWFFTPGGRVSKSPSGGLDLKALATAPDARTSDGSYWIADGKLTIAWAGEATPTSYSFEQKGEELVIAGIGATPVQGMAKGWRADVAYEGGASIGGGALASSTTIIFRKDGTYSRDSIGSIRSVGTQVGVSAYAQASEAGRYEFDGYTLTLTHKEGLVTKHTVFAFSDRDGQGAPEYLWRDGGMMRRQ